VRAGRESGGRGFREWELKRKISYVWSDAVQFTCSFTVLFLFSVICLYATMTSDFHLRSSLSKFKYSIYCNIQINFIKIIRVLLMKYNYFIKYILSIYTTIVFKVFNTFIQQGCKNVSKVTAKKLIMLQNIYISHKLCKNIKKHKCFQHWF